MPHENAMRWVSLCVVIAAACGPKMTNETVDARTYNSHTRCWQGPIAARFESAGARWGETIAMIAESERERAHNDSPTTSPPPPKREARPPRPSAGYGRPATGSGTAARSSGSRERGWRPAVIRELRR